MLDIGWTELVVVAIVLIVVVGPKDLPPMLRAFGRMTAKMRGMAADFRRQFDEALREADLDDVRKTISGAQSLNPTTALRDAMNPLRQLGDEIKSDLQKAATSEKPEQAAVAEQSAAASAAAVTEKPAVAPTAAATDSAPPAGGTKRAAKPKAASAAAKSSASATRESRSAGAPKVKKTPARKTDAKPETKTQKTRAASRRKGDA